jgi:hypothetical protein
VGRDLLLVMQQCYSRANRRSAIDRFPDGAVASSVQLLCAQCDDAFCHDHLAAPDFLACFAAVMDPLMRPVYPPFAALESLLI